MLSFQIRLTNGQCLTQTFSPNEELAAVRLYVEMNRSDGSGAFSLMTNFPKKVFSESDMQSTLSSLGKKLLFKHMQSIIGQGRQVLILLGQNITQNFINMIKLQKTFFRPYFLNLELKQIA